MIFVSFLDVKVICESNKKMKKIYAVIFHWRESKVDPVSDFWCQLGAKPACNHMNRLYILRFFAIFQYCSFLVEFFAFIHQTIVPVVNYAPFVIPF